MQAAGGRGAGVGWSQGGAQAAVSSCFGCRSECGVSECAWKRQMAGLALRATCQDADLLFLAPIHSAGHSDTLTTHASGCGPAPRPRLWGCKGSQGSDAGRRLPSHSRRPVRRPGQPGGPGRAGCGAGAARRVRGEWWRPGVSWSEASTSRLGPRPVRSSPNLRDRSPRWAVTSLMALLSSRRAAPPPAPCVQVPHSSARTTTCPPPPLPMQSSGPLSWGAPKRFAGLLDAGAETMALGGHRGCADLNLACAPPWAAAPQRPRFEARLRA